MTDLALRHVVIEVDSTLYFYDGELPVKEGVVVIPHGQENWAGSAWINGYQIDAETGEPLLHNEVMERVMAETSKGATRSRRKSSDESANSRGQSPDGDGLRESQPSSDDGLPAEEVEGSGGDQPADGEGIPDDEAADPAVRPEGFGHDGSDEGGRGDQGLQS